MLRTRLFAPLHLRLFSVFRQPGIRADGLANRESMVVQNLFATGISTHPADHLEAQTQLEKPGFAEETKTPENLMQRS
jgi:hypothetical protein